MISPNFHYLPQRRTTTPTTVWKMLIIQLTSMAVDSDWGGDTKHRKSVTGIIIRIVGGTVVYKRKYQDVVALSSTESKLYAASETGKHIRYIRTFLQFLGYPID